MYTNIKSWIFSGGNISPSVVCEKGLMQEEISPHYYSRFMSTIWKTFVFKTHERLLKFASPWSGFGSSRRAIFESQSHCLCCKNCFNILSSYEAQLFLTAFRVVIIFLRVRDFTATQKTILLCRPLPIRMSSSAL